MTLGEVIAAYRAERQLSMDKFSEISGLSKAYISILERNRTPRGGVPTPSIDTYRAVASAMAMDVDELIRKVDGKIALSPRLPSNLIPLPIMKEWGVLGATACGKPIHRETLDETVMAPEDIKADVVFRCVGHSMINARIFDGDLVFIRLQPEVENGQIAVVRIGDEYTLKRVYAFDGFVELRAENPTERTIVLRGEQLEDFEIVGLAVAFLGTLD